MNPPGEAPGTLTVVCLAVLVVAVLVFAAFALGGYRALPAVRRAIDGAPDLGAVYALSGGLVAAMALVSGTAFAAYRYEAALIGLAWDAYDVWMTLDAEGAAPSGGSPGESAGTLPGVTVAMVLLGVAGLVAYVLGGFAAAASRARALRWGAVLAGACVVLLGLAVVTVQDDVVLRETAWELWLGQELRP